ncbi:monocarboxylate transporter 7-like [Cydia fagiglandana]|uniref:monocarboxylate transporter 7-like n=1 Tax=Cydia fagiglandana TaxID=1458189 RepID=UPI002FEE4FFD
MPPKPMLSSTTFDKRESVTVITNKTNRRVSFGGAKLAEETEIQAQVHVPEEGCWGWVVVAAAFCVTFILDGIALTFGSIRPDMTLDLNISETITALINSIALALYLIAGPLVSALINRFGFRACCMAGSVTCSLSLFISYFLANVGGIILFYGLFCGVGFALINMSTGLVVGFYFEKNRSIAIGIATLGTSVGVMSWYPINSKLVTLAGWRSVTLFHSGMFGMIYFLAMTFRPLLSLNVVKAEVTEEPTRTVTYLPNVAAATSQADQPDIAKPSRSVRLFAAVKNDQFPTAADVVENNEESQILSSQPGPSAVSPHASKLTLTAMTSKSGISNRQLQQVKSIASKISMNSVTKQQLQVNIPEKEPKKVSCCGRLCNWERHVPESRPLYRDDAFYDGKVERLPEYQRSKGAVVDEEKTGLEYQLAVSRTAAAQDLQERRGVFTTAARRVLATMMDPNLLKLSTFRYFCAAGFLIYLGFLVPVAYIQVRNLQAGVDPRHCSLFVSAMGGFNGLGRLGYGLLAIKFCPIKLSVVGLCTGGAITILSNVSFNMYFQYIYSSLFGFSVSCVISCRALMLVKLYGLEKLTNATGMLLLFQGIGSLISTPLAGVLSEHFGYTVAFIVSGASIFLGGLMLARMYLIFLNEKVLVLSPSEGSNQPVNNKK